MQVKEHYDKHLSHFYSWMTGDFERAKNSFKNFCIAYGIKPEGNGLAIDLGAGHGIQSFALSELEYRVKAIDFNTNLLKELSDRLNGQPIEIVNDDLRNIHKFKESAPELIVCCGDTIAHLESFSDLETFFKNCYNVLSDSGQLILSYRDYSSEPEENSRCIPVRSDNDKILTCILDYYQDKVRVTDLFYQKIDNNWVQKVSSYYKLRISNDLILDMLKQEKFNILSTTQINGMFYTIARK